MIFSSLFGIIASVPEIIAEDRLRSSAHTGLTASSPSAQQQRDLGQVVHRNWASEALHIDGNINYFLGAQHLEQCYVVNAEKNGGWPYYYYSHNNLASKL